MSEDRGFVVCLYGRRFLRLTSPPNVAAEARSGWRSVTWTKIADEACAWSSAVDAEKFAAVNLHGEFVIQPA